MNNDHRKVFDLPNTMVPVKKELDRVLNVFWANKKDDKGCIVKTEENLALLYALGEEFKAFTDIKIAEVGETLLEELYRNKNTIVLLPKYGKKVFYDEEANWLFTEVMSNDDWGNADKKSNTDFLAKRKEAK
jgi:hypothetical protein